MPNTAVSANVLIEKYTGELKANPVTLHLTIDVAESRIQFRERVLRLVEEYYESLARVVSLAIMEPAEMGKRGISMRRSKDGAVEYYEAPKLDSQFRFGGEVLRLITDPAPLH